MKIARIVCEDTAYVLPEGEHSGANLRAFFGVPEDHDLWGERDKDDVLIPDDDATMLVEDGGRFYMASKKINQS